MFSRTPLRAVVLMLAAVSILGTIESRAATIILRSGNIAPTAQDPVISYLVEPNVSCTTPFPAAFTAADFAAADAGPAAWSVTPPNDWTPALQCDPQANWIAIDPSASQRSALYSIPFNVEAEDPCCLQGTIYFCWMADDALGDAFYGGTPNPLGAYMNGVGLPIAGGNYTTEQGIIVDISSYLRCGENRLYVYVRDAGCGVAGTIFHAEINYTECATPVHRTSWGRVRATYR